MHIQIFRESYIYIYIYVYIYIARERCMFITIEKTGLTRAHKVYGAVGWVWGAFVRIIKGGRGSARQGLKRIK